METMNPPPAIWQKDFGGKSRMEIESRSGILPLGLTTQTTDPNELARRKWRHIARKIERDPELLEIPLENIARWTESRRDGIAMLAQWKTLIETAQRDRSAFERLLDLLRADDEDARLLKSYSPFPGVLTSAEVDLYTCGWKH